MPLRSIGFRAILIRLRSDPSVQRKICGTGAETMEWVTPEHEQVNLNCEVSSYENAEL